MKKFIKILDPLIANKLAASGFSYIKETINKTDVYCFSATKDVIKTLHDSFSNVKYFTDDHLYF